MNIPKPDGGTRPLGVAAIEDKIVQKAVTEIILTPIYEAEFLGFSYGFRPGRGAHNALDALAVGLTRRKINWVVDCDIRAFFDNVSRDWLIRFLEHRIADKRVIRLIIKWLNAGVMEAGEWRDDLRGTPQGSVISPILANIYLHYVLDLWFQKKWRSREAEGDAIIVRYADDFVVGFQHKRDAERFLNAVKERFGSFELELHPDKTRLIEFGRFAMKDRRKRGFGRPETFDFLGFTHYCKQDHGRVLPVGAQAGGEADDTHPEANQGRATLANAPRCGGYGEVAGKSGQRMAELLRGPDQLPIPTLLLPPPGTAVASKVAPQVAEGPLQVGRPRKTARQILAQAGEPTPMAEPTIRRHCNPREEPRTLAGMRGSVRGALGNQRPYHDTSGRWSYGGRRRVGSSAPAGACTRKTNSEETGRDRRSRVSTRPFAPTRLPRLWSTMEKSGWPCPGRPRSRVCREPATHFFGGCGGG